MENPDDSTCQVSPSVLTYGSLETFYSSLVDIPRPISRIHFGQERLLNHIVGLGLPDETQHPVEPSPYRNIKVNEREIHFEGYVGQGLILIEDLCRKPDSRAPFTSEVCQALYQKHFPIGSLRVIFVMNVLNERTFDFIKESLYVEEHGLKWPAAAFKHPTLGDESPELAPEMKPQVWSRGSPELNALVGTPIGAIIARLILSAFPRGTHRISQVITWPSAGLKWPQTRWDIEPIQRT
ncbi:hypothetical protein N7462_005886 [Penicillium macrosclerotiorum]|uniref:uncharacterized protein n=1 Tax=Penicillium macrosclerotiorum TaxID=303699 RepID=UPI002546FF1D|nr:uncharacterized protein N7462_005886 [Penicillium macrosclerotiorum]KAJ5682721.1 hypothetical protein N7462_005886 [Penicillium macrosclerotiorum]